MLTVGIAIRGNVFELHPRTAASAADPPRAPSTLRNSQQAVWASSTPHRAPPQVTPCLTAISEVAAGHNSASAGGTIASSYPASSHSFRAAAASCSSHPARQVACAVASGRRQSASSDGSDDHRAGEEPRPTKRRSKATAVHADGGATSAATDGDGGRGARTPRARPLRRQAGGHAVPVADGEATGVAAGGAAVATDLSGLKVAELQALLKRLGLPQSGRKAELVERLAAAQGGGRPVASGEAPAGDRGVAEPQGAGGTAAGAGARAEPAAPRGTAAQSAMDRQSESAEVAATSRRAAGGTTRRSIGNTSGEAAAAAAVGQRGAGAAPDAVGSVDPLADLFGGLDLEVTVATRNLSVDKDEVSRPRLAEAAHQAMPAEPSIAPEAGTRRRRADPGSIAAFEGGPVRRHVQDEAPAEVDQEEEEREVAGPVRARQRRGGDTEPNTSAAASGPTQLSGRQLRSTGASAGWTAGLERDQDAASAAGPASESPRPLRARRIVEEAAEKPLLRQRQGQTGGADAEEARPDPDARRPQVSEQPTKEGQPLEPREPSRRPAGKPLNTAAPDRSDLGPPPDLDTLPPWPEGFMGQLRFPTELAPGDVDAQEELLLGNASGISLTSLGSAARRPTPRHGLGCLAMMRQKEIFLFDAGDDTQRQLAAAYHVKPSKIFRIFLTSLEPECVLGLPGLLCTVNSSREKGHEMCDIPLHVYGPPGTAEFVASVMRLSYTMLEVTTVVHEVWPGPVSEREATPYLYASRSRIWRVVMPPDQLNPMGGVDASLMLFAPDQGRSQKKRGRNASGGVLSFDPRAGFLPWPDLEPGEPTRLDVEPLSMTWTLQLDVTARAIINLLPGINGQPTLVYTIQEAERAGGLVLERALAAGVTAGRDYARLKAGETVTNIWGQSVPPSLAITPNRPGRRVVVMGNTTDPTPLAARDGEVAVHKHFWGADVLVAGAVFPKAKRTTAARMGGCTTDVLGATARRLGVRHVVLSRFDSRRFRGDSLEDDGGYAVAVAAEVEAAARDGRGPTGTLSAFRRVVVLEDMQSVLLEKNEGLMERQ